MKFDRENIKIANMLKFLASPEKLAFWRYAHLILRRRDYRKGVQMDCSNIRRCLLQKVVNPCPFILQAVVLYVFFAAK